MRELAEPILTAPPEAMAAPAATGIGASPEPLSVDAPPRLPAAVTRPSRADGPDWRAIFRSVCLHAALIAALFAVKLALPPLEALQPQKLDITIAEDPKVRVPGTGRDADAGSAAGASGAAAAGPAEPAAAAAAAATEPAQPAPVAVPVPPVPARVAEPVKPTPPKPAPRQRQTARVPPDTAPKVLSVPAEDPRLAPRALMPPVDNPAPRPLAPPFIPDRPPPPDVSVGQPPPPSVPPSPFGGASFSPPGGGETGALAIGTGPRGSGPGSAASGSGTGEGYGAGGPGRGSGRGDEYLAQLRRYIMRFHRYPDGARALGTAVVSFTVAADGRVGQVTLEQSAGDPAIDRDAVALLYRASPVPPPPPDRLRGGQIGVAIPVEYQPGFFERLFN